MFPLFLAYSCGFEPVYCISWVITWFSHDLRDVKVILRFFDFFLTHHPLMPVYVAAAVILHKENEIYAPASREDTCTLFLRLVHLPNSLPFERLLTVAGDLYQRYPPSMLLSYPIRT
ncbi:hypothetical protein ACOMHN_065666 [Nucella lapillus]